MTHDCSSSRPKVAALAVELTYACNQACAYCYNPYRGREHGDDATLAAGHAPTQMLLARVERILSAWDVALFTLTGGEPLRHRGIFALLERLHTSGSSVQVITNGTVVNEELARRLAEFGLVAAQITLNGPTSELHRAHVGRDSFVEARRGVTHLVRAGVPVVGCIVLTRQNAARVGEIIEIWRELGASQIALSRFSPAGVSLDRMREWLPQRQDLIRAFEQALPYARAGLRIRCTVPVPACLFDTEAYAPIGFGHCAIGSPYQEFALGPDGALRLCTLHPGKLAGGRDVLHPSLDLAALPNSFEVASYRRHLPPFCDGCSQAPLCLGGCGAARPFDPDVAPRALDPLVQQYFDEDREPEMTTGDRVRAVAGALR